MKLAAPEINEKGGCYGKRRDYHSGWRHGWPHRTRSVMLRINFSAIPGLGSEFNKVNIIGELAPLFLWW